MNGKRYYSLDVLKFIAAVLIIFHHFQQSFNIQFSGINFFDGKIYLGYIVELFFMLSGLFMAMGAERYANDDFGKFFRKRALRLFPMVWITVTVHAVILIIYREVAGKELAETGLWKYLTSMTLTFEGGFVKLGGRGFNNPIWYLCTLLVCYVLFWLVVHFSAKRKTNPLYMYVFMVLIGMGVNDYEISLPLFNPEVSRGVVPFFFGCVIWIIYSVIKKKTAVIISLVAITIALLAGYTSYDTYYDNLQMILIFMIYPALILLFMTSTVTDAIFNHKICGELGKISFEMYMWHVPVFSLLKLLSLIINLQIPHTYAGMCTVALAIIGLSTAMYYLVERPLSRKVK